MKAWPAAGAIAFVLAAAEGALALDRTIETETGRIAIREIVRDLETPWAVAPLPDGRLLVSERPGRLRIVSPEGVASEPVAGVPEVLPRGQGGLLDVVLHPGFRDNGLVYLTYAEAGEGGAGTAIARGRLIESRLDGVEVIFRQQPKVDGPNHFGARLAFAPDGRLYATLGERFKFAPAQELSNHLGKVIRIAEDGAVPQDNPFFGQNGARPEIWSYGHRNPQGAAIHPETGKLWMHEHGPRGGDELNVPKAGGNYGWPLVSWGDHYSGQDIPDPDTRPDLEDAIRQWTPVLAASGMAFYTGDLLPQWKGNLLVGGLQCQCVARLTLEGESVVAEERLAMAARVRDVRQAPDGAVLVVTDERDGRILRIAPVGR